MLFFVRLGRKNDRCRRIFSTVFHFQRRNTPKFPHFNYNIVFHAPLGHFRPFSAKRSSILRIAGRQSESRRYGIPWRGTVAGTDKTQIFDPSRRDSTTALLRKHHFTRTQVRISHVQHISLAHRANFTARPCRASFRDAAMTQKMVGFSPTIFAIRITEKFCSEALPQSTSPVLWSRTARADAQTILSAS